MMSIHTGQVWGPTLLQSSRGLTLVLSLLVIAVLVYAVSVAKPVYDGGYEDGAAPAVGATAVVTQRVTPVAGEASFDTGYEDPQLPVRTDGGMIDIGEQVVVVDHGPNGMALVETGGPPTVDGSESLSTTGPESPPETDSSASRSSPDQQEDAWTKPTVGRTSSYELTTQQGGRYALEVGPVLDERPNPPAHHDGTMLEALGELSQLVDQTDWSPETLDTREPQDWIAGELLLWVETAETIETPSEPETQPETQTEDSS